MEDEASTEAERGAGGLTLRQIKVQTVRGKSLALACKEADLSEQSYFRWRKEYGDLQVGQTKSGMLLLPRSSTIR